MISNTYDLFGELNAKGESREGRQSDKGGCYILIGWPGKDFEKERIGKKSEGGEGNNNMDI